MRGPLQTTKKRLVPECQRAMMVCAYLCVCLRTCARACMHVSLEVPGFCVLISADPVG